MRGSVARGIGIVNLVPAGSVGGKKNFYPMDCRIYAPDQDGKTKNEHFSEMVINAVFAKKIKAKRTLFYSWYDSAENLKLVATDGDIDWVITKCPYETLTTQATQDANDVLWQIEDLYSGLKQLTGAEKCQCHKARPQRNHIACCYHVWLSLKVISKAVGKTLYQTKDNLLSDYLRAELASSRIHTFSAV